jgi:hypothetical protein
LTEDNDYFELFLPLTEDNNCFWFNNCFYPWLRIIIIFNCLSSVLRLFLL